ncbi:hypothetical protein DY000_02032324 [Brassica cretica]|nr:hypothetical protein DY000_02032324 [Brassica cretica]
MHGGIPKLKLDNGFENGKKKLCEFLNQDSFDMTQGGAQIDFQEKQPGTQMRCTKSNKQRSSKTSNRTLQLRGGDCVQRK